MCPGNILRYFQATVLLLSGSGCTSKIFTNIQASLPARPEGSEVAVYAPTDSLPAAAVVIGNVQIKDSGFTTNCNYDQVLQLAKEETNKIGGNALLLTWHKEPSFFGSSCHQIAADMLLLGDSVDGYLPVDISQVRNIPAASGTKQSRPKERQKKNTLLINTGYGFIISDLKVPTGLSGNPRQGLDITISYQRISSPGLGFGLRYSGYFTSVEGNGEKLRVGLHYFAPEFVMRQRVRLKWVFHESIGIGYALYNERIEKIAGSVVGLGYHIELGVEYKFTESFGLGISAGSYCTRFRSMDKLVEAYGENEKAGINRLSVNGGVRFYF